MLLWMLQYLLRMQNRSHSEQQDRMLCANSSSAAAVLVLVPIEAAAAAATAHQLLLVNHSIIYRVSREQQLHTSKTAH